MSAVHAALQDAAAPRTSRLAQRFAVVRHTSVDLCAGLTEADMTVQSMDDASPLKWHLAHTTWFFETFLLVPRYPNYSAFCADFAFLFNSYYEAAGPRHPRPRRGLLTRPTLPEVLAYRAHVDDAMTRLLTRGSDEPFDTVVHLWSLDAREDDPERRCPDISKARRLLGWEPTVSLEEGLRATIEHFRVAETLHA